MGITSRGFFVAAAASGIVWISCSVIMVVVEMVEIVVVVLEAVVEEMVEWHSIMGQLMSS